MVHLPIKTIVLGIVLLTGIQLSAQYLPNPSLEGIPQPEIPPPGWAICTPVWSTPDIQPGNFGVFLPPSDGNTYLGMAARNDFTWEDVNTQLTLSLSMDSCYICKVDLAYLDEVAGIDMSPITLRVFGANQTCDKTNLIWQSPPVTFDYWETFEFVIKDQPWDITHLVMEAYYLGNEAYWGYLLMDNIRIETSPEVDLGNDTTLTLCDDGILTLETGGGYAGYLWSDGSTDSTLLVDTTGFYWVQVFNEYGCAATDTIQVTIEEYLPMQSLMIDSTLICSGQQVGISALVENGAEPYHYLWQDLSDTTETVFVSPDSSINFIVNVIDFCGDTLTDSIKVVVLPPPPLDLGEDTTLCTGIGYLLDPGTGYAAYQWQDGSTDSTLTATTTGWYWVQVAAPDGCTNTDSVFLEFVPFLTPEIGEDTILCEGFELLLDAGSGFVNYEWQDASETQTFLVTGPGVYWVTVEDEEGCTGTDTIQVFASPAENFTLGQDTTICEGDVYNLSPGPGFVSYLWQDGSTGSFIPVSEPGLFWVSVVDGGGCSGSDTIQIDQNPSPTVYLGEDTTICIGESVTLTPGLQYTGYLWQDNSSEPYYTVVNSGVYSVTVTNLYNCDATDEIVVTVSDPDLDLGQDTILCEGDNFILEPGTGYASWQWHDGSANPTFYVDSGGLISLMVEDVYGCIDSDTLLVSQLPVPLSGGIEQIDLCDGDTLQIEAPDGQYNYFWNGQPGDKDYFVFENGLYELQLSNACGTASTQYMVHVTEKPNIDLGDDLVLVEGESINLNAGQGYEAYLWQDGSQSGLYVVRYDQLDADDPYYYVEVTDGPCKVSDTITIIQFRVRIPAVFTPNGDQLNDLFKPFEDYWNGINSHHISVFNRWGEQVWESENFPSGWDGKRKGKPIAEGTYFWILEINYGNENLTQILKGTVTLLGSEN
ncbi:MAG: gliding motility-associated C-terminal domain-containing protein [Bacteroidales bacterium]|nr:gliding motility-associated C-terminal domain-containing protein [Bacteroidales bacterium]